MSFLIGTIGLVLLLSPVSAQRGNAGGLGQDSASLGSVGLASNGDSSVGKAPWIAVHGSVELEPVRPS